MPYTQSKLSALPPRTDCQPFGSNIIAAENAQDSNYPSGKVDGDQEGAQWKFYIVAVFFLFDAVICVFTF